ncbi:hypothetical protein [Longispora urticae]
MTTLPLAEAVSRLTADRALLLDTLDAHPDPHAPYAMAGTDPCESLHDLLAHVLMWHEINLAVLTEARAGRRHWSLDPRWETPEAGRALNLGGVLAGRELSTGMLLHRFDRASAALLDVLDEQHLELAQYVMTGYNEPYRHAAYHLKPL